MEKKMIQAKGIEKSFGTLKVLKGIDFSAGKSEVVAIMGASGVERVPSIWSNVDFPAPEAPMMETTSDFSALKSIPLSTFSAPNDFSIPFACIITFYLRAKVIQKKEAILRLLLLSGYCDSNTGPSGPKPDALANCATPRLCFPFIWDCKYRHKK